MEAIVSKGDCVMVHVRVQPKASRNSLMMEADGRIRIALTAPPVEGAANRALMEFLADKLAVPKRCLELVKGETSREKTVRVAGIEADVVRQRLLDNVKT